MAGWAGTKTWAVSDPWPNTEPNTYIRDNFNSVRLFQTSPAAFFDAATITTTPTDYASHASIMSATSPETFDMLVTVSILVNGGTGAPNTLILDLTDQSNTSILLGGIGPVTMGLFETQGHTYFADSFTIVGKGTYTGSNPGFKIRQASVGGTGTIAAKIMSTVTFVPH